MPQMPRRRQGDVMILRPDLPSKAEAIAKRGQEKGHLSLISTKNSSTKNMEAHEEQTKRRVK
jgi:hypothetical protein